MHQLDRIEKKLDSLIAYVTRKEEKTMTALDDLKVQVAQSVTVESSAIALINGLAKQLAALAAQPTVNPADLTALAGDLSKSATALAAAVTANTPAAPPAPPTTTPATPPVGQTG